MPTRALYSLVQYLPDASRAEAANVGVVLYVPADRWLETRLSQSLERVRAFFHPGKHELRRVELALEAFSHRMQLARSEFSAEEDLALFAAARADSVRLTLPRLAMVGDPAADLESLYQELVGDHDHMLASLGQSQSLPEPLAEMFGRLEAQRRVWRPGKIVLPTLHRSFDVPIAYRNGRVNYVKPESLAGGKLDDRLAKLGFNGQLIYSHPIDDQPSQLIVLSVNPAATPETESRYAATLKEFNVRFIPHNQVEPFAVEVEKTAHELSS